MKKTISLTSNVFVLGSSDPRQIVERLEDLNERHGAMFCISFWPDKEMAGWARLGTASIEMQVDEVEATKQVVQTLRQAIVEEQKKSRERKNALEDQINRLLAIGYDEPKPNDPSRHAFETDDDIPF